MVRKREDVGLICFMSRLSASIYKSRRNKNICPKKRKGEREGLRDHKGGRIICFARGKELWPGPGTQPQGSDPRRNPQKGKEGRNRGRVKRRHNYLTLGQGKINVVTQAWQNKSGKRKKTLGEKTMRKRRVIKG